MEAMEVIYNCFKKYFNFIFKLAQPIFFLLYKKLYMIFAFHSERYYVKLL